MRLPDSLLDDCLCDPSAPLGHDPARDYGLGKPQAQTQLAGLKEWLREQQSMLMANRQDALLLVLQGPDCAGKNGVVRRVLAGLDPLGMSAIGFQAPTPDERREGFLQRYRERLPPLARWACSTAATTRRWSAMCVTAYARWRTCRNATERSPNSNSGCTRNGFTPQVLPAALARRAEAAAASPSGSSGKTLETDPGRSARPSPLRRSPGAMGRGAGAHPPRRGVLVCDSCRSSLAARPHRRQPAGL